MSSPWRDLEDMSRLIVAIPAFNEESTLPRVLQDIRASLRNEVDLRILVVDDGSTDATVDVARNAGADIIVCHEKNLGVASAYKTAIQVALRFGADIICTIDGDGQFFPSEIPSVIEPIRSGRADFVIGSRFAGNNNSGVPTINRVSNKFMALLISLIIRRRLYDTESGFRSLSRSAAKDLRLLGQVSFSNDMILDLARKRYKIIEVPVNVVYYQTRVSKVITGFLKYGFKSLCLIVLNILYSRFPFSNLSKYHPRTRVILVKGLK